SLDFPLFMPAGIQTTPQGSPDRQPGAMPPGVARANPAAPRDHSSAFPVVTPRRWWGEFALAEGQHARWRIGPLTLWLRRRPNEWWIAAERAEDPTAGAIDIE